MHHSNDGTHFFYDVWESKMREIHLPETIFMTTCSASYRGWLLLTSTSASHVFLLNPLTHIRIQLPPSPHFRDSYFGKSKLTFSTHLTDPNCLIMVFIKSYRVMYCRVGDPSWTMLNTEFAKLTDATYWNGGFCFLFENTIKIVEPNKSVVVVALPRELRAVSKCFLEGKSGVYVLAVHPKGKFKLYQFQDQTMKFKHITETSDNTATFYGDCFPCFAVCSDDWASLDGGSVYVEYQCIPYARKRAVRLGYSKYSAKRAEGKEFVMCDLVKEPRFRPVEPAMWFQPSFH